MALLLWSGGCDSTLLLHDLLAASKRRKRAGKYVTLRKGEAVRTISINDPQITSSARQAEARSRIRKRLKARVHAEVTVEKTGSYITPGGIVQPAMWLLHASLYLNRNEDLYIGYVRGDDVWHSIAWVHQAFAAIQALTYKTGKLVLPLEWVEKAEVIDRLRRLRLLSETWNCEQPNEGEPCQKCRSCRTHATALQASNVRRVQ